jgi:hypothetical protein
VHKPTAEERRHLRRNDFGDLLKYGAIPAYYYTFNGAFSLEILCGEPLSRFRTLSDKASSKVEDRLNEMMVAFWEIIDHQRALEIVRKEAAKRNEEEQHRWWEEERRRAEQRRRQQQEDTEFEWLIAAAHSWRTATEVNEFLEVEKNVVTTLIDCPSDDGRIRTWLAWARDQAQSRMSIGLELFDRIRKVGLDEFPSLMQKKRE